MLKATTTPEWPPDGRRIEPARIGPGFTLAYAIAQTGAFMGFIPLLSILLPLKIQALSPSAKVDVLSPLLTAGAIEASVVNILAGWLSDRSRASGRNRAGWIACGAIGLSASLLLIGAARTLVEAGAGLLILQLFLNILLAPLAAVLPDRVPDAQKGEVAGWLSISHPVATLVGTGLIGGALTSSAARYGVLAGLVVIGVLPFAARLNLIPAIRSSRLALFAQVSSGRSGAFRRLWAARFFMQCAIAPVSAYLLYYVEDVLDLRRKPESEVAMLVVLSTLAAVAGGPVVGYLAQKGRGPLAIVAATVAGAGLALLALGPVLQAPSEALLLIGAGYGGFTALDTALAGEIAGRLHRAGRDLGLLNLAHTAPQAITPIWAWASLHAAGPRLGYAGLFGSAAIFSLLAGLLFFAADAGAAADARTTS